jgi:hypothetical protein
LVGGAGIVASVADISALVKDVGMNRPMHLGAKAAANSTSPTSAVMRFQTSRLVSTSIDFAELIR